MTNTTNDEFANAEKVEAPTLDNSPMVFIPNLEGDNIGASIVGNYLCAASFPKKNGKLNDKGQPQMNYFVDIRYDRSEKIASITKKAGAKYIDIVPKTGDIVTLFCPSKLYRQLIQLTPGDRFYAQYKGMKRTPGQQGGAAHTFEVKKAGNQPLTDAEKKHIENKFKAKEEKATTTTAPATDTAQADAETAMKELVD